MNVKREPASGVVLNRLAGKMVYLHGKAEYRHNRCKAVTQAHQGELVTSLDGAVDYVVIPDLAGGKGLQQKVAALNKKGASITLLDYAGFESLLAPTREELPALMRARNEKENGIDEVFGLGVDSIVRAGGTLAFADEKFDGANLRGMDLTQITFLRCGFVGAETKYARFAAAIGCDFSRGRCESTGFGDVTRSRFVEADLKQSGFDGDLDGADFTRADLQHARIHDSAGRTPASMSRMVRITGNRPAVQDVGSRSVNFTGADLQGAHLMEWRFGAANFTGANLTGAMLSECSIPGAAFVKANLRLAGLIGVDVPGADFSGADLAGANLSDAKLAGARFDGAELKDCVFRGADLAQVDMSAAKNFSLPAPRTAGPALTELDSLGKAARQIKMTVHIQESDGSECESFTIASSYRYFATSLGKPNSRLQLVARRLRSAGSLSDRLLEIGEALCGVKVRYEGLEVESTKSPKSGKELRELVIAALAEAFNQPPPPADELAAATKAWREAHRDASEVRKSQSKEEREKAEKEAAKALAAEQKKVEKQIAKAVGKVNDTASFLKALELRIEAAKISKATSMLKAAGFKLYSDITEDHLAGVVKSQTDPDLVYACRIESTGNYSCCTQNLNVCGGLRGSICKHLLVLITGLVQSNELDPATIDGWVGKTHGVKPTLDKEKASETFIRYKGAEAGEVDWRPTETVPEDYYAL